jgi:hypothetical protein
VAIVARSVAVTLLSISGLRVSKRAMRLPRYAYKAANRERRQ